MKKWNPPVPDQQMIVEAQIENTMRDIVEWRDVPGTDSRQALDKDGNVMILACGRRDSRAVDPNLASQDLMETGSQVIGPDDDWA